MDAYTTKENWDDYFKDYEPKVVDSVFFAEIFERYLKPDATKSVLEIGCAGGEYLCYMHKHFGFQPFGVDYSDEIVKTAELFRHNGLREPGLFKQDFFNWSPGRTFDVVYSIGFIEHFEDTRSVIERHVQLLSPGGTLVITLPHFANLQYWFHWLIDRENLSKHNTRIMHLGVLRKAINGAPVKLEHLDYYQTFGFWTERKVWNFYHRFVNWNIGLFGKIAWKLMGFRKSNFLFSPHIVLVATKPTQ